MFKILGSRKEDPGFHNAVLIVSSSRYWLTVDGDGHQLPPAGIAAVDSKIASSSIVAELVANGSIAVIGDVSRPKKKKKAEADVPSFEVAEVVISSQSEPENLTPEVDTVTNFSKLENETIVAESTEEKEVSSNENIVDPN